MKFARQARIFRGPLDPAAAAAVVLLLVIFMLLCSLLYTPGVLIELPNGNPPSVTDNPTVIVAVDSAGQCFFENKPVQDAELEAALKNRQRGEALHSKKLTLVLWADKAARNEVITHLETLAQSSGITEVLVAESPAVFGPQR